MKFYAVIDTNVLVSALLSKEETSATVEIYKKIMAGVIVPIYSEEIIWEYDAVLHRPKFGFDDELITELLSAICGKGVLLKVSKAGIILPDMGDVPFYAALMAKQDKNVFLVTGNIKHFPKKTNVVTPREMVNLIGNA